jgi:antitoxin (DNA-binding transcriptional repressor) of toxin-antitoxin stability system
LERFLLFFLKRISKPFAFWKWSSNSQDMELSVSEFKAKCLAIVEDIANKKERVVITRYGRAAAEVIPFSGGPSTPLFGRASNTTKILGDLTSTGETWNAASR